jgi:predicted nucleic acid-binding protein
MKRVVLDSSVCTKWFAGRKDKTADHHVAIELLDITRNKGLALIEPPIWRAEIVSKISRKRPIRVEALIENLMAIEARIDNSADALRRGAELSAELDHGLFDTLYHAVALNHSIDLITANTSYYRKARHLGSLILLRDLPAMPRIAERRANYLSRNRKSHAPARVRKKR